MKLITPVHKPVHSTVIAGNVRVTVSKIRITAFRQNYKIYWLAWELAVLLNKDNDELTHPCCSAYHWVEFILICCAPSHKKSNATYLLKD